MKKEKEICDDNVHHNNGQVNNNPTEGMDALKADINGCIEAMGRRSGKREMEMDRIVLDTIARQCQDLTKDILQVKASKKSSRKDIIGIVAREIVRVADGNLAVFHYSQRMKAEQTVHVFVGTHWTPLDQQVFYDFVNLCGTKVGLSEAELCDPGFMGELYHWVGFQVAHSCPVEVPEDSALINLLNGTLEVGRDGNISLRPHRREDYAFYCLRYCYDDQAECPLWEAFLDQMLPDKATQQLLAEYLGYCFTTNLHPEKMLVLLGRGSTGKSVVLNVTEALLGRENVSYESLDNLTNDDEKRLQIENKLANISFESGRELDAALLKKLVSGEPVSVRQLYVGTRTIRRYAKLLTAFNTLPAAEATHGFYRRFIIMPFRVTISEQEADTSLSEKLCQELPGILNWVLRGLKGLLSRGTFSISDECQHELENYKLLSDNVRMFAQEHCLKDETISVSGKDLYSRYRTFCAEDGLNALGKRKFFDRMESLGFDRKPYNGITYFHIKLDGNGTL